MLPQINKRKFTFDENSQQLNSKQPIPQFFLQNNDKQQSQLNQKESKSIERRQSITIGRSNRLKSEASSPKSSQTPQPGPGYYKIKYDQVQLKTPITKLYTDPTSINNNETLSKYLTKEFINRKMLVKKKLNRDEQNTSPGPGRYDIENHHQGGRKKSISYKFSQCRRDENGYQIGRQSSNDGNQSYMNNGNEQEYESKQLENDINIGLKLNENALCEVDVNKVFTKQSLNLITISNTQQHYKGRTFSKSPKKLSPTHIQDDNYINEIFDDISNENPGPGQYEVFGQFDSLIKQKMNPKNIKLNRLNQEKRQKVLLRPLQPLKQTFSPTQSQRQDFSVFMRLKQQSPQNQQQLSPQNQLQSQLLQQSEQNKQNIPKHQQTIQLQTAFIQDIYDNQLSPLNTKRNINLEKLQYQNVIPSKYLDCVISNQNQEKHFLFPHDFVKYDDQIHKHL